MTLLSLTSDALLEHAQSGSESREKKNKTEEIKI